MRPAAVAGSFYTDDSVELEQQIRRFLDEAIDSSIGSCKALIIPHAGYVYSGIVAAAGFKLLQSAPPKHVFLLGPAHHVPLPGAFLDTNDVWQTPLGSVKLAFPFSLQQHELAHAKEHSIEVQVPFLQVINPDITITPVCLGSYDPLLTEQLMTVQDVIIVSSDLSHYQPYEQATSHDKQTIKKILALDDSLTGEDACGFYGIKTLIAIAKKKNWKPILIDYKNSGDTAGDKRAVVGYACIAFVEADYNSS